MFAHTLRCIIVIDLFTLQHSFFSGILICTSLNLQIHTKHYADWYIYSDLYPYLQIYVECYIYTTTLTPIIAICYWWFVFFGCESTSMFICPKLLNFNLQIFARFEFFQQIKLFTGDSKKLLLVSNLDDCWLCSDNSYNKQYRLQSVCNLRLFN